MKKVLLFSLVSVIFLLVWQVHPASSKMAPGPSKDPITGKAYAGSEKCKSCHKAKYEAWKNTIHAWMVRPIAKGDFKNVKADLTVEGAPKPDQYDWAYVIGGWYKEERYTFWDERGNIIDGEFEYNKPRNIFQSARPKMEGFHASTGLTNVDTAMLPAQTTRNERLSNSTSAARHVMGPRRITPRIQRR